MKRANDVWETRECPECGEDIATVPVTGDSDYDRQFCLHGPPCPGSLNKMRDTAEEDE